MRRRQYRKHNSPSQNLDSFLDILTNTVGVLMFIGLFVSLFTFNIKNVKTERVIRTPLVSESNKMPHFFEVRDNTVIYLDKEEVEERLDKFDEGLPPCIEPRKPSSFDSVAYNAYLVQIKAYQICLNNKSQLLSGFRTTTTYYKVFFDSTGLVFQPRADVAGESPEKLTQATSEFRNILKQLNSGTDYLAFLVRADSFEAFREAREIAWQENFGVGWEPINTNAVISFGSGGRSIGVQ
ncbi:MAG: hypothetical protein F6K21_35265 [Symploca sp. SIO2D2]|nr:hypothetical protein [Symploca sp. SIO2D2]